MGLTKMSHHLKTLTLVVILHTATCDPAKDADRPVHEIINENARSDDIKLIIPYGNPLADKSLQNAKLHAQHQQAMFNAERVRQHRAQIMRRNQVPTKSDTYMRAYHDLQETQQLELEKEQSRILENFMGHPPPPAKQQIPKQKADSLIRNNDRGLKKPQQEIKMTTVTIPPFQHSTRPDSQRRGRKNTQIRTETLLDKRGYDLSKHASGAAAVNRNHRSHGSLEYHKYFPSNHGTVQFEPAPTYDQGVFIKTRSNIGFANAIGREPYKFYSGSLPSKTQYAFPKQYGQEYNRYISNNDYNQYLNTQNINALQTLLYKRPQEQANQLNALVENYNTQPQGAIAHPLFYNYVPSYMNYEQAYAGSLNQNYRVPTENEEYRYPTSTKEYVNYIPKIQEPIPLVNPTVTPQAQIQNQPIENNNFHDFNNNVPQIQEPVSLLHSVVTPQVQNTNQPSVNNNLNEFYNNVPQIQESASLVHPTVNTYTQFTNQPVVTNHLQEQQQSHLIAPSTEVTIEQHKVKYYGDDLSVPTRKTEVYKPLITQPQIKYPEVKHHEFKYPEVKQNEFKYPEVKHSEFKYPEGKQNEFKYPEVKHHEIKYHEVKNSETKPVVHLLHNNNYEQSSHKQHYHNNRPGVQRLTQDGTGIPAYNDDDEIKIRDPTFGNSAVIDRELVNILDEVLEMHYASKYEFGYRVMDAHAGNDFGHYENTDGGKTDGQYHVLLPDGRMQTVKYTAGPDGFHADISYDPI